MTLAKIEFAPGFVKDDTPLAAEGGYVDGSLVRFRRGKPQVIGGWLGDGASAFTGKARGAHAWADNSGKRYKAWGTASKLYAQADGGSRQDITPRISLTLLTGFYGSTGANSVYVLAPYNGLFAGDTVRIKTVTSGISFGAGDLLVSSADNNGFTIPVATPLATNYDGSAIYIVELTFGFRTGQIDGSADVSNPVLTWSLDNYGRNLLAVPRNGRLYQWEAAASFPNLATGSWILGSNWTQAGTAITATFPSDAAPASSAVMLISGMEAGRVYRVEFDLSGPSNPYAAFQVAAGPTNDLLDVGGFLATNSASLRSQVANGTSYRFSRAFYAPDDPRGIAFTRQGIGTTTIDNITVTLEPNAYPILTAPPRNGAMFVDPITRKVVLTDTINAAGVHEPLTVRWSAQENNRIWIPDTDNGAGENTVSLGSRAVTGLASRQQNLIWTDSGIFQMTQSNNDYAFRLLGSGCGLIGPMAAKEHSGLVHWWSTSGPWKFGGGIPEKVDCRLQNDVLSHIAQYHADKCWMGVNPEFDEFWFGYPDSRDGIECSRIAVWQYQEGHFVTHQLARTSWIDALVMPKPLAFSPDGYVFAHETGNTANGGPLNGVLQTAYFDIEDGENLMAIHRFVPDFKEQSGVVNRTLRGRPFPQGPEWVWGPWPATATTQKIDLRKTARQLQIRYDFTGSPDTYWRMGTERIDAKKTGALR